MFAFMSKYRQGVTLYNLLNDKLIDKLNNNKLSSIVFNSIDKLIYDSSLFFNRYDYIHLNDHDIYSFDVTMALIIKKGLVLLKKRKQGYFDVDECDIPYYRHPYNRYTEVMDKMIMAFDMIAEGELFNIPHDEQKEKDIKEGLRLFGKYYLALWY